MFSFPWSQKVFFYSFLLKLHHLGSLHSRSMILLGIIVAIWYEAKVKIHFFPYEFSVVPPHLLKDFPFPFLLLCCLIWEAIIYIQLYLCLNSLSCLFYWFSILCQLYTVITVNFIMSWNSNINLLNLILIFKVINCDEI